MTQILINLEHLLDASTAYNNIPKSNGVTALTDSTTSATSLTFEETLPPISSVTTSDGARFGYEANAVDSSWYTDATVARNVIAGSIGTDTITSIKFFGAASQLTARSTDVTINGVTKTHDANNGGAAPVEWSGADLTGITLPFDIDWVRTSGASFGYAGIIDITYVATGPTPTSIGGDDDIYDGETSVATVGTSFLAFAAGSKLELTNLGGTVLVDQLLTGSDWADTLITIPTIIRGGLKYTNDNKVKVTDSAAASGTLPFTLSPPTGFNAVDVVSPISDNTSVFFGASPAVATGDQAKVPELTDQGGTLLLDPSGTFTITGGGNTHTFELEVWDATDSAWSNTVVQTINGTVTAVQTDEFNTGTLNTSLWTKNDLLADSVFSNTASQTQIAVAAGAVHDLWTTNADAPRIKQSVIDSDVEIEVKFDSVQGITGKFHGVTFEQDADNLVRFSFHISSGNMKAFAATNVAGTYTSQANVTVLDAEQAYLKVKRVGDDWEFWSSVDGITWTSRATFTHALTVNDISIAAGNSGATPAYTAIADYFRVIGSRQMISVMIGAMIGAMTN